MRHQFEALFANPNGVCLCDNLVAKRNLAPAASECWIVAEALARLNAAPRWKRSSALTTVGVQGPPLGHT
jgi:hypothetical protein